MKRRIFLLLICLLTLTVSLCLFTGCDEPETPDNGGGTTDGGTTDGGTTDGGTTDGGSTEGGTTEGGGNSGTPCTHNYQGTVTKAAGCETTGTLTYTCSLCQNSYTEPIPITGHTPVLDAAKEPSFTETGLTEGSHCLVCKKVLVAQDTIPMLPSKTTLTSKDLTISGREISGGFSYATVDFDFAADIAVTNNAPWSLTTDSYGMQAISTKKAPLVEGNNVFYIHVTNPDQTVSTYTVNLYRNHLYTVTFNTNGGTAVSSQQVEEGYKATAPTTTRAGYTFASWSYDFNTPITNNIEITANWNANGNTPYKVEYYRQNVDRNGYDLISSETINTTGKTDTTAYAPEKTFNHFTINKSMGTLSGNINGSGTLVLKVYYTRNTYSISAAVNNSKGGSVTGSGTYAYEKRVTLTATTKPGYTFLGWFEGETKVCSELTYSFNADRAVTYTAKWSANENTPYKVEYYRQNVDRNGYDLISSETINTIGQTDTTAYAPEKTFDHFTINKSMGTLSGNINGSGTLVLKVYYTRNTYTISNANTSYGSITNGGTYAYGSNITLTATPNIGYNFIGWYSGETKLSSETTYTFTVDKNVEARFELKTEMSPFNFTSTATTCQITGIKDKTVTEIIVPDYVTSIKSGAFSGCTSLASVYITDIAKWCGISFGNYSANPLYYAKKLYLNGTLVTELVIPDSVTSIGDYAFQSCPSLTSVTIGNSVTSIGNSAFSGCDSLTSVTIPNSVTSIGEGAFYSCDSLTSVVIGNSVTSIGEGAFYSCTRLTSVVIGNSVTSIGDYAFIYCDLTSVIIPDSVTSIGDKAFYSCISLTSIKYRGTQTQWNAISKGSHWDEYYNFVPETNQKLNYTMTYNYNGN